MGHPSIFKGKKRPDGTGNRIPNQTSFGKGHKPWNLGLTKETNLKIKQISEQASETIREQFQNGRHCWAKGLTKESHPLLQRHSDIMKVKRYDQIFPVKDTRIELALQNELDSRNIFYEKHKRVLRSQPDLCFNKLAVFADGDYWHNTIKNSGKYEQDERQNKMLGENGWLVIRFSEGNIKESPEHCIDLVEEAIGMS